MKEEEEEEKEELNEEEKQARLVCSLKHKRSFQAYWLYIINLALVKLSSLQAVPH